MVHRRELVAFAEGKGFKGKGPLSVALVVTGHARNNGLPLDPGTLLTEGGGQVLGLGKAAVQGLLRKHGVEKVLASEGGRTSRGSIGRMREYVDFLNGLHGRGLVNLQEIERFWIERVHEFFSAKPFKVNLDVHSSLRLVVRDVIKQASDRQSASEGTHYLGAVLQHLVGAKLDCVLSNGSITHHSSSAADASAERAGDFLIGDVVIHVTAAPGEAVIEKCRQNMLDGYRPILVTLGRGLFVAEGLAANADLGERIDVFEIEQFIALNIYELGRFVFEGRKEAIHSLLKRYNQIVEDCETDPSLKIELRK